MARKIAKTKLTKNVIETLPEESEDQLLVVIKKVLVLGLEFADERLATRVHVHGGDEREETLGGGVIGDVTSAATVLGSAVAGRRGSVRGCRSSVRRFWSSVGCLWCGIARSGSDSGVESAVLVPAGNGELEEDSCSAELDGSDGSDDGAEGAGGAGNKRKGQEGRHLG